MSYIVAFDPASKNAGFCISMADNNMVAFHVNLTILDGAVVPITSFTLHAIIDGFVTSNNALWPLVGTIIVEQQMRSIYKEMALTFISIVKTRFPHIQGGLVSPSAVRAFFGTRVFSSRKRSKTDYDLRKLKSVDMLPLLVDDIQAFTQAFHPKLDDVADAVMMAIYAQHHPTFYIRRIPAKKTTKAPVKKCKVCRLWQHALTQKFKCIYKLGTTLDAAPPRKRARAPSINTR